MLILYGCKILSVYNNGFLGVFSPIVQEVNADPEVSIKLVIADMPERHTLRGMMPIQGRFSCEFCVGRGDTGSGIRWPFPKYYGKRKRTHQDTEAFAR